MNPTNLIPQWQFDEVGKFTGIQWVLPGQTVQQKTHAFSESRLQESEPAHKIKDQLEDYSKAS